MPIEDRKIVGRDVAKSEFGWPLGRAHPPPGRRGVARRALDDPARQSEARVIFGIDGADMILLHGHEKKPSQQRREIATAQARCADYQCRKGKS